MVKYDDEAAVNFGRLNQTWKSRRDCLGSAGSPPAVAAFQATWGQARTPAPQGCGAGLWPAQMSKLQRRSQRDRPTLLLESLNQGGHWQINTETNYFTPSGVEEVLLRTLAAEIGPVSY